MVIYNGILSDSSIKDLMNIDYLNGNVTNVLVNNLRKTLLAMSKSEDDIILKRYSLIMMLNSDVDKHDFRILSKIIDSLYAQLVNMVIIVHYL